MPVVAPQAGRGASDGSRLLSGDGPFDPPQEACSDGRKPGRLQKKRVKKWKRRFWEVEQRLNHKFIELVRPVCGKTTSRDVSSRKLIRC